MNKYFFIFLLYIFGVTPLRSEVKASSPTQNAIVPPATDLVKYPSQQEGSEKEKSENALLYTDQERKKLMIVSSQTPSSPAAPSPDPQEVAIKFDTVAPNIPSAFSRTPSLGNTISPLDRKRAILGGEYLLTPSEKDQKNTDIDIPINTPINYVGFSFSKPW